MSLEEYSYVIKFKNWLSRDMLGYLYLHLDPGQQAPLLFQHVWYGESQLLLWADHVTDA